uniref:ABC transporter F family member 4-like n=1 Tax=Erigeron canadensis TaxID=72917 RepID=UPI001CB8CFC6|nr:ABC transporter F family member 4-like [Erigeron canadensis]
MVRKTIYESKDKKGTKEKDRSTASVVLSMMDKKRDCKGASSSSSARKTNSCPKLQPYYEDIDLPPPYDDYDDEDEEVTDSSSRNEGRRESHEIHVTDSRDSTKLNKKKKTNTANKQEKQEPLKDGRDAFSVTIGRRVSVLEHGKDEAANANVKDITVNNFSVSAPGKQLLKNASLTISHGKRYGLVGPNGTGKSTLLKLLAWREIPVPKNIDILMVEQEIVADDRTVIDAVVSANEKLISSKKEFDTLTNDEKGDVDNVKKAEKLYEELQIMGADSAVARASKILAGLGFTSVMQNDKTKSFSGGWRMRISLAQALFVEPTLLLLDEPTNHLDLRAVLWLEEYLCSWKNTLVVVSHNRDFLNTVCNEIIHLDVLKLESYSGNYDNFENSFKQKKKVQNKDFDIYEKKLEAEKRNGNQKQLEKVKENYMKRSKGNKKLDENDQFPEEPNKRKDYVVQFHFHRPTELRRPLLKLDNVSFSYPRRDFKLSNVDVGIDMGTRVAIVGPNGAGKSTLLKLLDGKLNPTEGEVWRSPMLKIGRYSQHFHDLLTMEETPVQYLLRLYPNQEGCSKQEPIRAELSKFGLKKDQNKRIAELSGGQKARVVFTSISLSRPHILLLDEPTNHLDMQSIDALADALKEFKGGVVLISHDSKLISSVCEDDEKSEIWEVDNGSVIPFDGTFEEYKRKLLKEIRDEIDD